MGRRCEREHMYTYECCVLRLCVCVRERVNINHLPKYFGYLVPKNLFNSPVQGIVNAVKCDSLSSSHGHMHRHIIKFTAQFVMIPFIRMQRKLTQRTSCIFVSLTVVCKSEYWLHLEVIFFTFCVDVLLLLLLYRLLFLYNDKALPLSTNNNNNKSCIEAVNLEVRSSPEYFRKCKSKRNTSCR